MGSQKGGSDAGDPEDLPSDFFDDFNKDEFMQGLSVIDSWDDDETGKRRIDAEAVDSVRDLRELIDNKDDDRSRKGRGDGVKFDNKFKWQKGKEQGPGGERRRSGSRSKLDEFIKPGSRRDPNKTNEAIKRDKEVKVKELLDKHLDDDLRPPGTELDDYYNEGKPAERTKVPVPVQVVEKEPPPRHRSREYQRPRQSPPRYRRSPHFSPRRSPRREFIRRSPYRNFRQFSPQRRFRRFSPHHRSPRRQSPMRRSPRRISPPRGSPRRARRSRSPISYRSSYGGRRSQSPKPYPRDTFLYPNDSTPYPPAETPYSKGPYPGSTEYTGGPPEYSYPPAPSYAGGYGPPGYEYGVQPQVPMIPQPVPAPAVAVAPMPIAPAAVPAPHMNIQLPINPAPPMVPPPTQMISPAPNTTNIPDSSLQPYDALAQLVADGKLSQQDYLKLAPNKGVGSTDPQSRVAVLNRCQQALSKMSKLLLPNSLTIHQNFIGHDPKYLAPKYCSPLKRQAAIEFQFTKVSGATVQQNKQLVDSIIATIGLDKVVSRPKKKIPKDMKDAAVQTTKPYCDVCEIRESTRSYDAMTSIDPEHFCATIHTQVVEQDLISSKSIFNPTGSSSDSAPISIAHMTPAQLVSQLAARAKTLKQTEPVPAPNSQWRNPPNYGNRGGHYNNYDNYGNYRY